MEMPISRQGFSRLPGFPHQPAEQDPAPTAEDEPRACTDRDLEWVPASTQPQCLNPPGAHTIPPGLSIPRPSPSAQLGKARPASPLLAGSCPQQAGPAPPRDAELCVGTAAIPSPFSPPLSPGFAPQGAGWRCTPSAAQRGIATRSSHRQRCSCPRARRQPSMQQPSGVGTSRSSLGTAWQLAQVSAPAPVACAAPSTVGLRRRVWLCRCLQGGRRLQAARCSPQPASLSLSASPSLPASLAPSLCASLLPSASLAASLPASPFLSLPASPCLPASPSLSPSSLLS